IRVKTLFMCSNPPGVAIRGAIAMRKRVEKAWPSRSTGLNSPVVPKEVVAVPVSLLRPFAALRPAPEYAAEVAAPPYDVLSTDEARAQAEGKPWTFLHISKAEIDLPAGTDPYDPAVYAKAADN